MHAEVDLTLPLPGLSPVCGKPVVARFDGGQLSSDGGILLLAEGSAGWGLPSGWRDASKTRARLTRSATRSRR